MEDGTDQKRQTGTAEDFLHLRFFPAQFLFIAHVLVLAAAAGLDMRAGRFDASGRRSDHPRHAGAQEVFLFLDDFGFDLFAGNGALDEDRAAFMDGQAIAAQHAFSGFKE